jgi:hypothetical protein
MKTINTSNYDLHVESFTMQYKNDMSRLVNHKARGPLATIQGLCKLIDKANLSGDDLQIVEWIEFKSSELDVALQLLAFKIDEIK